jgi:lipoprotein-anchoring transpeptidase ErfK/SrfK
MPIGRRALLSTLAALPLFAACAGFEGATMLSPPEPAPPPDIPPLDYGAFTDGGHRVPAVDLARIPEQFHRQVVPVETAEQAGTVVIDTAARHLFLVLGNGWALRYGISVGRDGFGWSGVTFVHARRSWPTWTPPPEMIRRQPELARWAGGQPGGPSNPLGARAIYLVDAAGVDRGYRIHGTPEWRSIGSAASSGCFRMLNHDVIDLYDRVRRGTKVVVV